MRALGLAATVLALCLGGCGGSVGEPLREEPDEFAQRVVRLVADGEAGAAWEELHPDHQRSVPRALYVRCEGADGLGEVERLAVTRVREVAAVVPGSGERPATEVALTFELDAEPVALEMHVFRVDGRWRWVIGARDWQAYAAGDCPAQPRP